MDITAMSDASILKAIDTLQSVQKATPPTTPAWVEASALLRPLYAEMAKRHPRPAAIGSLERAS